MAALSVAAGQCPTRAALAEAPSHAGDRPIDPSLPTAVPWSTQEPPGPSEDDLAARRKAWYDAAHREFEEGLPPLDGDEDEEERDAAEEADRKPGRGIGMIITGASMSVPLTLLLLIGAGVHRRGYWAIFQPWHGDAEPIKHAGAGVGVIVFAVVGLAAAATLLGVGGHRLRRWRQSERAHVPTVDRTALGTWTIGVERRF